LFTANRFIEQPVPSRHKVTNTAPNRGTARARGDKTVLVDLLFILIVLTDPCRGTVREMV
jgi:hypothetical protein